MKTETTLWTLEQQVTELGQVLESNEFYHCGPGISFTGLKQFSITPQHYLVYRKNDKEETTAQRLGTLAHMAILEPETFKTIVVPVEGHRANKEVKTRIAELESDGKYVCKPNEYEAAIEMMNGIQSSSIASKLLSGGVAERSIRWRDESTGVLMKCRPDYLRPDGVVVDIKTFDNLTEENIERQINKMKYHWQSAFYLSGVNQLNQTKSKMFAHIFIDTKTFCPRVVVLDDASLEKAEEQLRPIIDQYAVCLKEDKWPGYSDEILTVALPHYAW